MELFLISLLVLVLFIERGGGARDKLLEAITSNYRGVIKYFGSAAVLSLSLSLMPGIMLSIYMRHNGFFSYEVFGDQRQAIDVLSLNVLFNFLIISVYLFSTALLWGLKASKVLIVISIFITMFMILVFITLAISTGRYALVASIFAFCLFLAAYLYFWISQGFSEKARFWWIPLGFSIVLMTLPIFLYKYSAILTENALFQMRVGGMEVELSKPLGFGAVKPETVLKGKLLLRTPEFYYIRPDNNRDSVLIISTEHVSIEYKD